MREARDGFDLLVAFGIEVNFLVVGFGLSLRRVALHFSDIFFSIE